MRDSVEVWAVFAAAMVPVHSVCCRWSGHGPSVRWCAVLAGFLMRLPGTTHARVLYPRLGILILDLMAAVGITASAGLACTPIRCVTPLASQQNDIHFVSDT